MIGDLATAVADVGRACAGGIRRRSGSSPAEYRTLPDEPTVVVPALMSSGHPSAATCRGTSMSQSIRRSPSLARLGPCRSWPTPCSTDCSTPAGVRRSVVLGAAGTRHPHAQSEVEAAAAMLCRTSWWAAGWLLASPRPAPTAPAIRRCATPGDRPAGPVPAAWQWRHICWRTAYFRAVCAWRMPMWWPRRWVCIPR